MATPKYNVRRARIFLQERGSFAMRYLNNVEAASASFEEQTLEKESTTEQRGVIASVILSTRGTFTMTLGDIAFENYKLAVRGKQSVQSAGGSVAFTIPMLQEGEAVALGHRNIISTNFAPLIEGVDYVVFQASGILRALRDITTSNTGSYDHGVAKLAGIAAGEEKEYIVHIDDALNGQYTQFFRFKPNLAQNLNSISPNEFGAYEVTGQLLLDESKPVSGDLGQFGFMAESQATA